MKTEKKVDISEVKFQSTVFPTPQDMELWESLTPEQRKAVEAREVQEGIASGVAHPTTMSEIIAKAKTKSSKG